MGDNYQDRKDIDKLNDLIWDTRNGQSKVLDKETFYAYQQLILDTYVDNDKLNVSLSSKEDTINKVSSWNDTVTDMNYPSEKLVKDSLDDKAPSTHNHIVSDITDFPSIPSKTSDLTNDCNFISTSDTTGLIKNDGSIDQSIYLTSSDITDKEDVSNKVSSWSSNVSDTHYPSEKLVMDTLNRLLNRVSVNADKKNIQKDSTTTITGFKLLNGSPVPNHTLLFYANVTVTKATPTISLSATSTSINVGDTLYLSGTLSIGSGKSVKIYNSSTLVDTVTTTTDGAFSKDITGLSEGSYTFKATYDGDSNYNSATSSNLSVTVSSVAPSVTSVSLASDKSILSAYDSDSAILTATLNDGITGETVTLYNGSTSLGTMTDNGDGTYSKTYTAQGTGDVSLKAVCDGVESSTISVEDCIYYGDWNSITSTWTKDTTTLSGHTIYTFSEPISEDIDFEWKFKNSVPSRWVIGFEHENSKFKGIFSKESSYYIYWTAPNSTSNTYESVSPSITTNSIVKLQTENLHTIKWYSNGSLLKTKSTNTSYPLRPLIRVNNSYGMNLDYVKLKPL